ncbi:MAG TPA: nuclear transport factor 2 family protein [Methanocorpusculum sp.]|nr:nuclear transport factor 2 family protein [Methanocorpusculum sp.]
MSVSAQTKDQITALLNRYQTAYNDHNAEALTGLLAADVVMYCCRTEKVITSRESFLRVMEENFARCKNVGIRFADAEIKSEGVISWLSASCILLSTAGSGAVHEMPCRFTAVLRGTGHAWEFVQIHMSLGYPYHA